MDRAIQVAADENADVVLGIDGDGDRVVFGDRRGILSAGFVTVPILRTLLDDGKLAAGTKVLYDPKVNPLALAEWGRLGVEPVLFRNGHSQIKDYMNQIGALAGAEESGHYYHELRYQHLKISGENSDPHDPAVPQGREAQSRTHAAALEIAGPGLHHRRVQLPVRRRYGPRPGPRRRHRPVRSRRRDHPIGHEPTASTSKAPS